MGRVKAIWCIICKKTTHQEKLDQSGALTLFECRSCFAKNVEDKRPRQTLEVSDDA